MEAAEEMKAHMASELLADEVILSAPANCDLTKDVEASDATVSIGVVKA